MLEQLVGNRTMERVLLSLQAFGEGYAQQIADRFGLSLSAVQRQLCKLEDGGIAVSQLKGRTRLYVFNPRWPFLSELRALLEKTLSYMPEDEMDMYYRTRTRPRRQGKP